MNAVIPLPGISLEFLRTLKSQHLSAEEQQIIITLAGQILERRHTPGEVLSSPEATKTFIQLRLVDNPREVFGCVFLDNRHRVLTVEDLFFGTVDGASVHPRIIVQKALTTNAVALICYHNHPSGMPEPSQADLKMTQRITDALKLVDVRLLDHIIVGAEGTVSLAERSLL